MTFIGSEETPDFIAAGVVVIVIFIELEQLAVVSRGRISATTDAALSACRRSTDRMRRR